MTWPQLSWLPPLSCWMENVPKAAGDVIEFSSDEAHSREARMPDNRRTLAVHYFYLLRDAETDLAALWNALTEGGGPAPSGALDLGLSDAGLAEGCQIMHWVHGAELDFCLGMLPRLAVVGIYIRSDSGEHAGIPEWKRALGVIDEARRKTADLGIALFGETTTLVSAEKSSDVLAATAWPLAGERGSAGSETRSSAAGLSNVWDLADERGTAIHETRTEDAGASRISAGRQAEPGGNGFFACGLSPELVGGREPLLLELDRRGDKRRFFVVAAAEPDSLLATHLPQIDAAIRFLVSQVAHFAQQRSTIAAERAAVDRQVGELLHRQVVLAGAGAEAPEQLDEKIGALSRLFGMLATDALLIRQAEDHLRGSLEALEEAIKPCLADGGTPDEIGAHYRDMSTAELDSASAEADKLGFSRGNAQAAIEVVRTQVELLRAGEEAAIQSQTRELLSRSLVVQQERLALQVAAGFVEFVLLFYYVLKSWEGVIGQPAIDQVSPLVRMATVGFMSLGATIGTHFLAKALHNRSWKSPGLWVSVAVLLATLTVMIAISS